MRVVWKRVIAYNLAGEKMSMSPLGPMNLNGDAVLDQIRAMITGEPISFEAAVALFFEDLYEAFEDPDMNSFEIEEIGLARWMGAKGFKIILTGKEFEITN